MRVRDSIETKDIGGVFDLEIIRDGKHGPEVIERRQFHNLIVNTGKRQLWRVACGLNTHIYNQMRIGTSGAAPGSGNTNVLSPVTGTLNTVDSKSLLSGTRTLQLVISYPSGGASKSATGIKEVAVLFTGGTIGASALARGTFTAVNKTTSDKLKITYQCRIT